MEVFWIIILVLVLYIPMIILISFVRALFSLRKGKTYAKERFRDTFLKHMPRKDFVILFYIFSLNY